MDSEPSTHPDSQGQAFRYDNLPINANGLVGEDTELSAGNRNDVSASDETLLWNKDARSSVRAPFALRRWVPGVAQNMPWKFLLVLLGTFAWAGACIGVIYAADDSKVDSWRISPTVILAILGPLASIMLQYALSCGLVIVWWKSALGGTTLGNLHRQWDHGTSVVAASTSGRHMDKIALAKIMVLSVFAVNPLLQRALSTNLRTEIGNVTLSTEAATSVHSLQNMNFTYAYRNAYNDPVQLGPDMIRVMKQFNNREPITDRVLGCAGNCSGTLVAAGIEAQCSTVHNASFVAEFGSGDGEATLVFETGTNKMVFNTEGLLLTVFYAETKVDDEAAPKISYEGSCHGVSTMVNCVLQHAVIAYPFTLRDGIITPETRRDRIKILSAEPVVPSLVTRDRDPIFGGLSIAADSIFNSSGAVVSSSAPVVTITSPLGQVVSTTYRDWEFRTSGPLTAAYLAGTGDVASFARTCAVAFNDPTEDILSKLNEIQNTVVVVYESRYNYLWGALAITVLAAAFVAWTASGFQALGRPVSLSPVEIATAFGSPLLQKPGTSNMTVEELLTAYKGTRIQYLSTDGSGTEEMTGDPNKRLQLTNPGQGTKPRAQETFPG
ncbi:hypothetical protein BJ166DRAFT_601950 [Pestalotiopsis sp. NC0098]|nr:hypothetical protein BJ166DRAFT_601950 [Pestalotiopsis sp. NC0098]